MPATSKNFSNYQQRRNVTRESFAPNDSLELHDAFPGMRKSHHIGDNEEMTVGTYEASCGIGCAVRCGKDCRK